MYLRDGFSTTFSSILTVPLLTFSNPGDSTGWICLMVKYYSWNGEYRKLTKDKQNSAKTYVVSIEETVVQEFEVEATNEEEALKPAEERYNTGEYVLWNGRSFKR